MHNSLKIGKYLTNSVDYILVVDKDFNVVFSTRFDPRLKSKFRYKEYSKKNFFELFPNLPQNNESSVYESMKTGEIVVKQNQEFIDILGRKFITHNITIPIKHLGEVLGVIELSKDITSIKNINTISKKKIPIKSNINYNFNDIITKSKLMKEIINKAKVFSRNNKPTLIYGETGTGKELFAQSMIEYSKCPKSKVVIQNCAAIPESLIDSILFGTVKGSYTGAYDTKGLFHQANDGIIFLDELNSLSISTQAKLLRILQDGSYRPIGSSKELYSSAKVIATMNVDPQTAIKNGILRKDLFYRFNGIINIPNLKERKEDVKYYIDFFIKKFNKKYNKNVKNISNKLRKTLENNSWKGNVRELMHTIETMISLTETDELYYDDLPAYLNCSKYKIDNKKAKIYNQSKLKDLSLKEYIEKEEQKIILNSLKENKWNITITSEILKIPRQTLHYKINKYGINK